MKPGNRQVVFNPAMVPIPAKAFYELLRDEEGIDRNVIHVKNLFSSRRGFFYT